MFIIVFWNVKGLSFLVVSSRGPELYLLEIFSY